MNRPSARSTYLICTALSAITLTVFWPVAHFTFIGYDDPEYVTKNPHVLSGLTWENIRWAFVTGHASNWHPLTWLSHIFDVQLFGLKPGLHHLTNLLFHCANTLLLFFLLRKMTGAIWRSAFVAALFAIHPLHVESVAWVAERKDVLSGFFFMLTLLAYAAYARSVQYSVLSIQSGKPKPKHSTLHAPRSKAFYALALVLFACGLMSKPMLVTLPFVLLLLDFWPLGRIKVPGVRYQVSGIENPVSDIQHPASLPRLLLEKLPFFALSAASSMITFFVQQHGGAVENLEHVSFIARTGNASMAYVGYLEKFFWPSNLSILYLRRDHWSHALVSLSIVLLTGLSGVAYWARRGRPYLTAGWLWFVGMLVPVIGLVQVGNQYMADRYTYLPYIGLFIVAAWGGHELLKEFTHTQSTFAVIALALIGLAAGIARQEVSYWKDTETLFGHCLATTRNNFVAHNILGASLDPRARFKDAKAHFMAALEIQPDYVDALRNMGILLTDHGDYEEAQTCLNRAISIRPSVASIYGQLAFVLDLQGRTEPAIDYYRQALQARPDDLQSCNNLAWILATNPNARLRKSVEAVGLAEHACELTSQQQPAILGTLAAAYAEAGRFESAIATAQKAISVAETKGEKSLVEKNRELLQLYQSSKPYRDLSVK